MLDWPWSSSPANLPQDAWDLSGELSQLNRRRRKIEQDILEEAVKMVESVEPASAIVVGSRGWHVGVVGIVAARLVERYHRPAITVGFDEHGFGRGSVRTVPGLDIIECLRKCSDLVEGYGGHPAAAGLTIQENKLGALRDRFSAHVADQVGQGRDMPSLDVDAQITLKEIQWKVLHELNRLHPFGMGNPEPIFVASRLQVLNMRRVGDDHLKLVVRQGNSPPFESLGFRMWSLLRRYKY